MTCNIIIISNAKNCDFHQVTQNAINSALSTDDSDIKIYVVEQQKERSYKNAITLHYNFDFNYNKCLNYGFKNSRKADYYFLANNDLRFHANWCKTLINEMEKNNILSASPFCPISMNKRKGSVIYGYDVRKEVAGWALMLNKKVFDLIGKIDEQVKFWRSEDVYIEQLKYYDILHALIQNSLVTHLDNGSKTLNTASNKIELTTGQYDKNLNIKYACRFSVIMPVTLIDYDGAATDRKNKFIRAVNSFLNQDFKSYELIIISDGCLDSVKVYQDNFIGYNNIKMLFIDKQPQWSGTVRQKGIDYAKGEFITYIDSDDIIDKNHLSNIDKQLLTFDWVYYNNSDYKNDICEVTKIVGGICKTCNVTHKRRLPVSWNNCSGYMHDIRFIEQLMPFKHAKIDSSSYKVMHINGAFDE